MRTAHPVTPLGPWYGLTLNVVLLTLDSKANLTGCSCTTCPQCCPMVPLPVPHTEDQGLCSMLPLGPLQCWQELEGNLTATAALACGSRLCSFLLFHVGFFPDKRCVSTATCETIVWLGSWAVLGWDSAWL